MHLSTNTRLSVLLVLVSHSMGCGNAGGPPLGTVTGIVTLNSQPVPGAAITFVPRGKGSPSYGATDKNGQYSLLFNRNRAGAEVGTHDVLIEPRALVTDDSGKPTGPQLSVPIPAKYRQPGALSKVVVAGRNKLDLSL